MAIRLRLGLLVLLCAACGAVTAQPMKHPGVLVSRQQLDFIRKQVREKKDPIYGQYLKAVASPYAAFDYKILGPPETGIIDCGPYSRPDHGCHAEDADASAAYLQAVLWWITRDHRYAANSIRIMNTYSRSLKGYTGANAHLQAAWSAEMWPRAAEIIHHSRAGWKRGDVQAFSDMLTQVILPLIHDGAPHNVGNWELSMIEGMMGIAVFTDDPTLLHHAEGMWTKRVESYFYNVKVDGDRPKELVPMTHEKWFGQTTFDESTNGISAETCRDLGHTGYSIAATMAAAETAHIQGGTLYESEKQRLIDALEFHAHLLLKKEPVPADVCGGTIRYGRGYTFAIGYNEYHNRLGQELPQTRQWLDHELEDPLPVDDHMMVFELLTHGEDAKGTGH
ncbi:MAG TPA: alginate lyase family protein [Terracidiphilus sp.]|nr:alginate lyase family protein [Terracidiphilus sp.]